MGKPARLVYIIDTLAIGGAERHLARILGSISRSEWTPSVYCLDRRGPFVGAIESLGVEVAGLPSTNPIHLYRYLRRERPAIVHAYLLRAGLIGSVSARLAGVPHVITTRRIVHTYRGAKLLQYRLTTRAMDLASDRVVAVCDTARRQAIAEGTPPGKISTIYNAVSPRAAADPLPRPPGEPIFGSVASLHPRKGHRYLISALPAVLAALPGTHLMLAGDGPERGALEAQARDLGVLDRVTFLGARTDVENVLPAFDVLVLPSIEEGLPNSLLEAMAAGVPVVATAVGGVPEIVHHDRTGLLVPPASPDALSGALIRIGGDAALGRRLAQAAQEQSERLFHPDVELAAMESLYRNLCGTASLPVAVGASG